MFLNKCKIHIRLFTSRFHAITKMNRTIQKPIILSNNPTKISDSKLTGESKKDVTSKFEILPTPIKSASDKKEYKVIRLENGLTACLIADKIDTAQTVEALVTNSESESDSEIDNESTTEESSDMEEDVDTEDDTEMKKVPAIEQKMAAAALCVGVGSFSDPKQVPGMAHFLEHMVFMGSEKFPQENDFDSFIKKRGGSDNASTDYEFTTFYFECLEKHLSKGLDKFAQFFISPLMKRESMTREREAIDSEFQMALPSDTYRKEQLLASLCMANSPVNSFTWGNLITLKDNVTDDALYDGVHEFRKRHYSAHRMTVAIQARLPMETLESFVLDCFSKVPNNNLPSADFSNYTYKIFDTPEFKKMYYVKPVKQLCQVDLTWALPSLLHMYKSKPHQYVAWLLGDEGKGSLLSYLRKKVWALAIYTGNVESGIEHNSLYTLFNVNIVLTTDGLTHLSEVIEAVFSYISMMKHLGPQERIFKEIQSIHNTSFKFSTEETAVDTVESLVEDMHYYPPEDYIAGSELYYNYDPDAINMVMELLIPDKMNILILTNRLPNGVTHDKIEPWFKTPYAALDIPCEWVEKWKNTKPFEEFALPQPNPFLTEDFTILDHNIDNPEYPQKILSTPTVELWYRKDDKFKLPIAYYCYYLITPISLETPAGACMMDMFVNLLTIQLTEEAYSAVFAELSFSITHSDKGLLLNVNGFNQKLPVLIELIVKHLKHFENNLTVKMFDAVKDKLTRLYYNRFIKPSSLAKDLRLNLLLNNYWTPIEKYTVISKINFDMMKNFNSTFVKNLYVKGLVQGNVSKEIAINTTEKLISDLCCEPLLVNTYPKIRVVELPKGERCIKVMSFNKNDSNSIITNYYQSGEFSVTTSVIIELIMLLIEEPLFDILRTKEQLGYHVFCTIRDTFGILGYTIAVNAQAVKNTTEHVDLRIEAFIKHANKLLKKMSDKKVNQAKRDLIKVKQCVDVHLQDEVNRNWSEISSEDYLFDRLKQEIKAIQEVKVSDIRKWWEENNMFGNKNNFRKLSLQVVGYDISENKEEISNDKIDTSERPPHAPKNSNSDQLLIVDVTDEYVETNADYSLNIITDINSLKEKKNDDYFINDIETFKKELFLYPVVSKIHLFK